MRKIFLVSLFILSIFALASCTTITVVQRTGNYSLALPTDYEYNTAESMNAEPGCVGVFVDSEKHLPELWIYSFNANGRSLENFVAEKTSEFSADKAAVFNDYNINGQLLKGAVIEFNENWYDTKYYNYYYIVEMNDSTFMCLDFACNPAVSPAKNLKSVKKVLCRI